MKILYYLFLLLFLAGCSSTPDAINFDIDRSPLKNSPNIGVIIPHRFSTMLPSSTKMIFYFPGNEVKYDMFNNWAQTPQELLARYFMLYFNNPGKPVEQTQVEGCTINGTVYDFYCDTNTNEAVFAIDIVITDSNGNLIMTKLYASHEKVGKLTASDFARAMSKAVDNVTNQIYKDILSLKK